MITLAALLGVASAVFSALGAAVEQHAAKRETPTRTMDPRLLGRLLRRRLWWSGWLPDTTGTILQALALRFGPLALVEPLLVGTLFIAIPVEAALERRRPHSRDLVVVTLGMVGLASFLVAANPRPGVTEPSTAAWFGVVAGVGLPFTVCLFAAWKWAGAIRGTLLGIATGLLYGVGAALLKTVAARASTDPLAVLTDWQLYAFGVVSLGGLILQQNSFQSGPIAAPLTAVTLVEPISSVLIGVWAFHERLAYEGVRLPVEIVGAALMVLGVWLASTTRAT